PWMSPSRNPRASRVIPPRVTPSVVQSPKSNVQGPPVPTLDFGLWTLDLEKEKPTMAASDNANMTQTNKGVSRRPRRETYSRSRGQKATLRPIPGNSGADSPAYPPAPV